MTKNDTAPAQPPLATPEETAARVEEQQKEYGTYVAVAPIQFNGVPAYNAGDSVPVSNVVKHGYEKDGLVAKIDSKEGQEVIRRIHEASQAEITPVVQEHVSLGVPLKQ